MPRDPRLYMTFPIDFWRHPKVTRLSDAAFRAFVEANGHSRILESDGVLDGEDAEFMWSPEVLTELLKSHPSRPLLLKEGETYRLRDYAEHQFTTADQAKLHEDKSKAGKASADSRRRTRAEQLLSRPQQAATEIGIGIETTTSKEVVARKRASTVPLKFEITDEMRAWGKENTPLVDLDAKLPEWIDYWQGTGKAMKDWTSVWRNGMRKQQEFAERDRAKSKPTTKIAKSDEWMYR